MLTSSAAVILTLLCAAVSPVLSKPVISSEEERRKIVALAEMLDAKLAAHHLEDVLRDMAERRREEEAEEDTLRGQLELMPHELRRLEQVAPKVRLIDLEAGKDDEKEMSRYALQFLDNGAQKRSKNFLKLANQAARGFGRK